MYDVPKISKTLGTSSSSVRRAINDIPVEPTFLEGEPKPRTACFKPKDVKAIADHLKIDWEVPETQSPTKA